jgi:hypothetical protein
VPLQSVSGKELVGILAAEGMSTRAIAPIVGVHHDTVAEDLKSPVGNPTPEITSRDSKTYTPKPDVIRAEMGCDGPQMVTDS